MGDFVGAVLLAGCMGVGRRIAGCGIGRRTPALAQAFGQGGKALRGGFGDVAAGLAGLEAFGRQPDAAQQGQVFGLVHLGNAHFVRLARVAGELRVDADGEPVGHHQNGRVGQRQAVGEQLLEGRIEVLARRLVLPGEHAAHEDVGVAGLAADDCAFLFKAVALGAAGLGHAEQLAQVEKVALRALLLVERVGRAGDAAGRAPFGDEVLGGHRGGAQ